MTITYQRNIFVYESIKDIEVKLISSKKFNFTVLLKNNFKRELKSEK